MKHLKNKFVKIILFDNSTIFAYVKDVNYYLMEVQTLDGTFFIRTSKIKSIFLANKLLDTMSNKELIECLEFVYGFFLKSFSKEELKNV